MFGVLIINVFSEMSIEGVKSTMSYLSGVDANPAIEASTIPLLTSVIIPTNEPLFSLVLFCSVLFGSGTDAFIYENTNYTSIDK